MSCGEHHELDCEAALARLYDYVDNCIEMPDRERIAHHLQECRGCFDEFAAEQLVKIIVARSCCQSAPPELRSRVVTRIESMAMPGSMAQLRGLSAQGPMLSGMPPDDHGLVDPLS